MAKPTLFSQINFGEKSDWFTLLTPTSLSAAANRYYHTSHNRPGVIIEVIVTSAATLSATPKLETVDDSGNVLVLWQAAAAIAANGTFVYALSTDTLTGMAAAVTEKALVAHTRRWNLNINVTAGSGTFEIHACYV